MRGAPGAGLDDRAVERLLTGTGAGDADLEHAVTLVRSLATGPAPQPNVALAQLLDTGFEPAAVPLRRPTSRRTWTARAGAAFSAAAASLVLAGTAQALPPVLQDGLADLVGAVTPFELPRSAVDDPSRTPRPAAGRTAASTPTASSPASRTSAAPTPTAPAAGPTEDEREDQREDTAADVRTAAERQERDRQRAAEEAAEESAEAAADAADESRDAAEDAARARESAARDAARASERAARESARASQEAAEESAEQSERAAEDAED